jgi:hypothetical protein
VSEIICVEKLKVRTMSSGAVASGPRAGFVAIAILAPTSWQMPFRLGFVMLEQLGSADLI